MRTKLKSNVTLLFVVSALLLAIPAVAALAQDTGTSPAPTIQSDKDDYAPGELVTLTGSGWQPGESVHINVNDQEGQTWSRNVDVTADASGNISDSFNLPNSFVPDYDVTATGAQSGTATTTFTDSQPLSVSVSPTSVTARQGFPSFGLYNVTVQMGGNSDNCTVKLGVGSPPGSNDTGLPDGARPLFDQLVGDPHTGNVTYSTGFLVSTEFTTPPGDVHVPREGVTWRRLRG